jgi:transcriptional regulator with XRE-family HTH domain
MSVTISKEEYGRLKTKELELCKILADVFEIYEECSPKIGKALKYVRIYHNLKQIDLAERLDISPSYLSEIETGKKSVSMELLEKYSRIFKIPASSLLLFSERMDSSLTEKGRVFATEKIMTIIEWFENLKEGT